jgi:LIVCS family branched-chain amino acid:cation transporter
MKRVLQSDVVTTGFAIFSMFFGAGNVVFPLALAARAGDMSMYAIGGLLLTAVLVPLLGLLGMILFDGDFKRFFYRIGMVPGYLAIVLIIAIIGPLGAMPRCVVLSYSTMQSILPQGLSLLAFSVISSLIIFLLSFQKGKILDVLGKVLSPILLISLMLIIVRGLIGAPQPLATGYVPMQAFLGGLKEGFFFMDLLATVFFSTVVLSILKSNLDVVSQNDDKKVASLTLKSGVLGATLLAIVYVGMGAVAACYGSQLVGVADDMLISVVAQKVLGGSAAIVASVAVALACLTTAITLASVSAEFLRHDIFRKTLSYGWCLAVTCGATVVVSTLGFNGIKLFLGPILKICYPAIFVLALCNVAYKLWGVRIVMTPVYGTLVATVTLSWYGYY